MQGMRCFCWEFGRVDEFIGKINVKMERYGATAVLPMQVCVCVCVHTNIHIEG